MSGETNFSSIKEHVKLIMSQTDYTEDEAHNKLKQFSYNYMNVLKDYMGVNLNKDKDKKVKSVNQEIFKQIRLNLDSSMREYREQNPVNIHQVIDNFNESDERIELIKN